MDVRRTIGIIGLGAFGQLMADHLKGIYDLCAADPSPEAAEYARANGIEMLSVEEVAVSDIVILSLPVPLMEGVLEQIKDHVKLGALIMDVGSVKMKPAEQMMRILPEGVDLIGTHPLFGPVGASQGTKGLKIVFCPLRGPRVDERMKRIPRILEEGFGIETIITTPEEHDKEMAYVQGLPHLIAKVLIDMEPLPRRMVTPNYKHFLRSIDVVRRDTDDLFKAIMQENPFSKEVRDEFFEKAEAFRKRIEE